MLGDTQALRDKELTFDMVAVEFVRGVDGVVQFHFKLVGVMDLNACLDEIFIMFIKAAQTTSCSS